MAYFIGYHTAVPFEMYGIFGQPSAEVGKKMANG